MSKGAEFHTVYIVEHDQIPSWRCANEQQLRQEHKLKYVIDAAVARLGLPLTLHLRHPARDGCARQQQPRNRRRS